MSEAGRIGLGFGADPASGPVAPGALLGTLPPLYPEWLGDRSFQETHGVRFPYVAGEMANGIASESMVVAMARAAMLGFFGAGGLSLERVDRAIGSIRQGGTDPASAWGVNLIHSPQDPALEEALVDLLLRREVRRASASAFMALTPAVVRYACTGLTQDPCGRVRRTNHVFAKVSRAEVARPFMSPAPRNLLDRLVASGQLTEQEARLAERVPVAEDVTVEADSGGHTDGRPLTALFPLLMRLRDELESCHNYDRPVRLGAAGGIATPASVAAAFAMGASYVVTGSVNQASVESALSDFGKQLLAQAELADVAMAPAGDMFELGVKVQVLKRGTMFATRAARLYQLYEAHLGLEEIAQDDRARLEQELFKRSIDQVWDETRRYFEARNPEEIARAERDPKHRMALVFRWYLGQSSRWAIDGDSDRRLDYQIWCGPAMGAFNQWVKGSFLEPLANRSVVQIALNLLEGAAVVTRAQQLRSYGVPVPAYAFDFRPVPLA